MLPTCERFDVLVEGKVELNRPALAECFLEWPFAAAEKDPTDGDVVGGFNDSGGMPFLAWTSLGE
jgi:hypothetical protein